MFESFNHSFGQIHCHQDVVVQMLGQTQFGHNGLIFTIFTKFVHTLTLKRLQQEGHI